MFEVRDEEDLEIKQYTHNKDIVEMLIQKEDHIQELEDKVYRLMILPMQFLKQIGLMAHSMQPRYMSVMSVRNMIEKF
jgi:ERCC4-related helicase